MKPRDYRGQEDCLICDYPMTQQHRVIPGAMGGRYEDANTIFLCGTHHDVFHFLMKSPPHYDPMISTLRAKDPAALSAFETLAPVIVNLRGVEPYGRESSDAYSRISVALIPLERQQRARYESRLKTLSAEARRKRAMVEASYVGFSEGFR